MRRCTLSLVLIAAVGLAGCGQSASEKLLGKWKFDPANAAAEAAEKDAPNGQGGFVRGMADAMGLMMELQIEFKRDRTVTMSANVLGTTKASKARTWEVTKVEGDNVTLEMSDPDSQTTITTQIAFVDDDHIQLVPPGIDNRRLTFSRVEQQ